MHRRGRSGVLRRTVTQQHEGGIGEIFVVHWLKWLARSRPYCKRSAEPDPRISPIDAD
jgi:hypothetical protein